MDINTEKRIIDQYAPLGGRLRATLTHAEADELLGAKCDMICICRIIESDIDREILQSHDELRSTVVGTAFPCEGGWVLALHRDSVVVLIGDDHQGALNSIKMVVEGGGYHWEDGNLSVAELMRDDGKYSATYVSEYDGEAQKLVQEYFNLHTVLPITKVTS